MPLIALIIMFYHVKIACYQLAIGKVGGYDNKQKFTLNHTFYLHSDH